MDRRIAELADHPVELSITCGCTRVLTAKPGFLTSKLGHGATIEEAERRLKCPSCGQRPKIAIKLEWAHSGGRDRRPKADRKPLPAWIVLG